MSIGSPTGPGRQRAGGRFPTTRWSIVVAAGDNASSDARAAVETLCEQYWHPIYIYLRRRGHSVEEAQDLTQGFFYQLLSRDHLVRADQDRGRFRSWLLTCLRHFASDQWDRARALKRGGDVILLRFDVTKAERRYLAQPPPQLDAEKAFDRDWARSLVDHVIARLEREYARIQKGDVFTALRSYVSAQGETRPHRELGRLLGMTEVAVRQEIHRLRRRFRQLLRNEIAHTVERPEDVDDELRYLVSVLL